MGGVSAVFYKEVRSWQRRLWWLPMAGAVGCVLPLVLVTPPAALGPDYLTQARWWWGDEAPSPIPAARLTWVVLVLAWGLMAMAGGLAYHFRWSQVHSGALADVSLTRLAAGELAVGQVAAATVIAAVPLVAALPPLLFLGVMAGQRLSDLFLGVGALLLCPLAGALLGYSGMWWRVRATAALRGTSSALLYALIFAAALLACAACGMPFVQPVWYQAGSLGMRGWRFDATSYYGSLMVASVVWGAIPLAALSLLAKALWGLWRQRRWGKLLAPVSALFIALGVLLLGDGVAVWVSSTTAAVTSLARGRTSLWLSLPLWHFSCAAYAFGGKWLNANFWTRLDDWIPLAMGVGSAYWLLLGLDGFWFAVNDLRWTLRRPAFIAALRGPSDDSGERAVAPRPRAARPLRRREGGYPFISRNPVYDYCLLRARRRYSAMLLGIGVGALAMVGLAALFWEDYVSRLPDTRAADDFLAAALLGGLFFCGLCGLNGGLTIARLKAEQQWHALLLAPMEFRHILLGVCLPCWGEALTVALLVVAFSAVGVVLRAQDGTNLLWQAGLGMLLVTLAFNGASLIACAYTKGVAKAALLGLAIGGGMLWAFAALQDLIGRLLAKPYAPTYNLYLPSAVAAVIVVACTLPMLWRACGRLQREAG